MPNLKSIDVDNIFKTGLNFSASSETLTPVVARNFFIDNQKLATYNTFKYIADVAGTPKKIWEENSDVVLLTSSTVYHNWTYVTTPEPVQDFVYFYGQWIFLNTSGNKIFITNNFTTWQTVNLPTSPAPGYWNAIYRDEWRIIVANKEYGVLAWSGFQDPTDWTYNAPGETLHGFYQKVEPPIINIHNVAKDTIIVCKKAVYNKQGDYPYTLYKQALQTEVLKSAELNNIIYLLTPQTLTTLRQTAKYGDFEHVSYIDAKINSWKYILQSDPWWIGVIQTGIIFGNPVTNIYYDALTNTFWEIYNGLWFVEGKTKKDYWWDRNTSKIYVYDFTGKDKYFTASIETSEQPVSHICKILSYSIEAPEPHQAKFFCSGKRVNIDLTGGCFSLASLCTTPLSSACSINVNTIGRSALRKYVRIRGTLNLSFKLLTSKALKVHNFIVYGQPA